MSIWTTIKYLIKYMYYKVRRDFAVWRAKKHVYDKDPLHFQYYSILGYYYSLKCDEVIQNWQNKLIEITKP